MSFEDFAATCTRTFGQTPIRLIRITGPLSTYVGSHDPPYRHQVLLCQPHFGDNSISIAFYLNGTAYFEYLNEEKIRQRLQLLNNPRKTSYHREDLEPVFERLKTVVSIESIKQENPENELHAKLLSARLLSVELFQADLKFKFRCEERAELYEHHYVRQLLIQVQELSKRQTYLCQLLEHKDELPQFDSKLFLSTPMTLIDDNEEEEEDAEILSTSTIGRLWKSSFGRRGGQNFLDICLLKKAYVKALEEMDEPEPDADTNDADLNKLVEETIAANEDENDDEDDDQSVEDDTEDESGLVSRITKRSIQSTANNEYDSHKMKRLRSSPTSTNDNI